MRGLSILWTQGLRMLALGLHRLAPQLVLHRKVQELHMRVQGLRKKILELRI